MIIPPSPLARVSATWLWFLVCPVLMFFPAAVRTICPHPYLSVYYEILFVGLVPVLFITFGSEKLSEYGITGRGLAKSLFGSLVFVAADRTCSWLISGHWMSFYTWHPSLSFPAKVYYASLGIFAFGPLEMFFIIYLVRNTEQAFQGRFGGFLLSLTVTAFLFGLSHIFYGLGCALEIGVTCFVLGLIFGWTQNSIGPMLGWTLLDQQVWSLASMLWS